MNSRLSDAELAARIAQGAGEVLLGIRSGDLLGGAMLGDVGDALAQAWISTVLRKHRPRDAVLSEEAADVGDRATASRAACWNRVAVSPPRNPPRDTRARDIAVRGAAVCLLALTAALATGAVRRRLRGTRDRVPGD